jgi:hypothetical protein
VTALGAALGDVPVRSIASRYGEGTATLAAPLKPAFPDSVFGVRANSLSSSPQRRSARGLGFACRRRSHALPMLR